MKIFMPASSTTDSTALLYHGLKNTKHEIVTRIIRFDTHGEDLERYESVCNWLKNNVRNFDFGYSEFEDGVHIQEGHYSNFTSRLFNFYSLAKYHKADEIWTGYNSYNYLSSTWYFSDPSQDTETYYSPSGNIWAQAWPRIRPKLSESEKYIPAVFPFLPRNNPSAAMGRWTCYETIPEDLRKLTSSSCNRCGRCYKCKVRHFYYISKKEGKTAAEIDDYIMKTGRYGKYFVLSEWENIKEFFERKQDRHLAYKNLGIPRSKREEVFNL